MVRDEEFLKHAWLLTYTGKLYWPTDPKPEDVCLEDVAHALSQICRFSGMTRVPYSVAEHSVHVSHMVPKELAMEALLHDASEAYCNDMIRPLKREMADYKRLEKLNEIAVRTAFYLPHDEHPLVKEADTRILKSEYRWLFPPVPDGVRGWFDEVEEDCNVEIFCWDAKKAEYEFLKRHKELMSCTLWPGGTMRLDRRKWPVDHWLGI
jgi:hypothetical protein